MHGPCLLHAVRPLIVNQRSQLICVRQGQMTHSASSDASSTESLTPYFSFGLISDVQYADIPDGKSFHGTKRYYRASLDGLHRAVDHWRNTDVGFAMHLGDILDGFCPRDQSNSCLNRVLGEFVRLELPVFHMLGNHCLYNLPRPELNDRLGIAGHTRSNDASQLHPGHPSTSKARRPPVLLEKSQGTPDHSYYSFSPASGWRFVVLDGYDLSVLGWPASHPNHQQALRILEQHNPNEEKNSPEGLVGLPRRFVKFGGGFSDQQLTWLDSELEAAAGQGQRVLICCHLGLCPDSCAPACLAWNYESALDIMHRRPDVVVATFSGHAHRDGYQRDAHGIHHRVLKGVIETPPGQDCFATVACYDDRLEVVGADTLESGTYRFAADEQDVRSDLSEPGAAGSPSTDRATSAREEDKAEHAEEGEAAAPSEPSRPRSVEALATQLAGNSLSDVSEPSSV